MDRTVAKGIVRRSAGTVMPLADGLSAAVELVVYLWILLLAALGVTIAVCLSRGILVRRLLGGSRV